jgi:hypothetical protein
MNELEEYRAYLISQGANPEEANEYIEYIKAQQANEPIDASSITQEMPEWLESSDRAKIKNFAQSPEVGVKYLQGKYPDADVRLHNGETLIRKKGESGWKVLDPDTGLISKDIINDVTDIGYDIADDALSSAATALGGIVGTFVAPGAGTLAGASLAGGASSAALEAGRQKIGEELGLPQEVDAADVAVSGGVGAISPLLFGSGATTKDIAKALAKKQGKSASKELLEQAAKMNRGGLERTWDFGKDKAMPWMASVASGRSTDSIKNLQKNLDYVDSFAGKDGDIRLVDEAEKVTKDFADQFNTRQRDVGSQLADEIDQAGKKVDVSKAKGAMKAPIIEYEKVASEADTPVLRAQINRLKKAYDEVFGLADSKAGQTSKVKTTVKGGLATDESIEKLADWADETDPEYLAKLAEWKKGGRLSAKPQPNVNRPFLQFTPNSQTTVGEVPLDRTFDWSSGKYLKVPSEISDQVSAKTAWKLQQDLKPLARFNPMDGLKTSSGIGVDESRGRSAAKSAYHALNKGIDEATEGMSSKLKTQYKDLVRLEDDLSPFFSNEGKTLQTLRNIDSQGKMPVKRDLARLKEMGIDKVDDFEKLQAASQWSNAGWLPQSLGGTTSTSRTVPLSIAGGALGFYAGSNTVGGPGAGTVGGATGALIGGLAGSPAAVKALVRSTRAVDRGGKSLAKKASKVVKRGKLNAASKSIYNTMLKEDEDEN